MKYPGTQLHANYPIKHDMQMVARCREVLCKHALWLNKYKVVRLWKMMAISEPTYDNVVLSVSSETRELLERRQ